MHSISHGTKYTVVNRTNQDRWSFREKERAQAFLKFVIDDFMNQHDKNDQTIERLYAGDFIVTQFDDEGQQVDRWIGLKFFE